MKKAVILFSGGLDSTTCLALALKEGYECHALSFQYGQKHCFEIEAAQKIALQFNIPQTILHLPIGQLGGSALTDANIPVANYQNDSSIPNTYVPARNTIFLSFALGFAEILQAQDIFIGVSAVDYSNYPDCRPEYIAAFQTLANLATKDGVSQNKFKIHSPLVHLSKAETIQLGLTLGVDYSKTVSCYRLSETGSACRVCDSCVLRQNGFKQANTLDPTNYA